MPPGQFLVLTRGKIHGENTFKKTQKLEIKNENEFKKVSTFLRERKICIDVCQSVRCPELMSGSDVAKKSESGAKNPFGNNCSPGGGKKRQEKNWRAKKVSTISSSKEHPCEREKNCSQELSPAERPWSLSRREKRHINYCECGNG